MRTLYTFIFCLLLPLAIVRLFWRSRGNSHYRKRIAERFSFIPKRQGDQPCIWIHAVSVGEVIAATPMVKQLMLKYPHIDICVTTTTPTGSDRVRAALGFQVYHYYLPYDVPSFYARFIKQIQPSMLIIMETELWPNLIFGCKDQGIDVLLANGRLSNKSAKGYAKLDWISRPLFGALSFVAAQSSADAKRFKLLGVDAEKVINTGNIKFDISLDDSVFERQFELANQLQLDGRKVAIFASTHLGEDEKVIPMVKRLHQLYPEFVALIVPRHLERFGTVYDYSLQHGLKTIKITDMQPTTQDTQVIIGDTMGDMLAFYGLVDIAFIGGTLVLHGGHNYLEAAAWGLPLISGKSVRNFQAIAHQLQKADALNVVEDCYELERNLEAWLSGDTRFSQMGMNAKKSFDNTHGALQHLLNVIGKCKPVM